MSFPDIEDGLKTALADEFGVPTLTKLPGTLPSDWFIDLRRVGGGKATIVSELPIVEFHVWSTEYGTRAQVVERADEVRTFLSSLKGDLLDGGVVHRVTEDPENGPANDPDPETGRPRITFRTQFHVGRVRGAGS